MDVPVPRAPGGYRVALVCLGNICRSPMADVVLSARVADAGLGDAVTVVSAGTGDWHVGETMDRRAAALLTSEGYDPTAHRAQQVATTWFDTFDLLLAMDEANLADLYELDREGEATSDGRVRLFRDFDPEGPGEVPDPYYGGDAGFTSVLAMAERTSERLVALIGEALGR
ncbi:low molecular weight protein-tyrosine-phosphatase [Nocardioides sp. YIM 152588]|uniref:low molecular weight protein-tyrosine-phosphatase n=1 Tax=Nocardioides sp. YIM 152588 TaxID=3158259 RepID=UPI0032E4C26A